jgi:hypothetical protein
MRQQRNLDCYVEREAISSQATQKRKAVPRSNVRGTWLKMFVCLSIQVTLVATKLLVRLFILTFNQYTYIIIRFCCITTICSDGSTVILTVQITLLSQSTTKVQLALILKLNWYLCQMSTCFCELCSASWSRYFIQSGTKNNRLSISPWSNTPLMKIIPIT